MNDSQPPIILGLDPGTRYMGAVVVRGRELLAYAVHELRNGQQPHDLIGQARRAVFQAIAQHGPEIVAIEAPYLIATKRGATLTVLADELHGRAKDLGLTVEELSPEAVRRVVAGNPKADKIALAEALVRRGFQELAERLPRRPTRSALGLRSSERYWLHIFDALGLAVAVQEAGIHTTSSQAGSPTT